MIQCPVPGPVQVSGEGSSISDHYMDFVVVLYRQYYIGRVIDSNSETQEVCIEFMSRLPDSTTKYFWKEEGDAGFEKPMWEMWGDLQGTTIKGNLFIISLSDCSYC